VIRHGRPIAGLASVLVMLVPSQDFVSENSTLDFQEKCEMLSLRTGRCRCAACHSPSSLYLEGGAYAGLLPEAPLNTLVEKTGPKEGGVRVSC